jgi:uncharacterized protein YdiU (UPF0061 family)
MDTRANIAFGFDNSYARLPRRFYAPVEPAKATAPLLIAFNTALAEEMGLPLKGVDPGALAEIFSGNRPPGGAEPIASAYAGHQFGGFSPQLGDGRALLYGEIVTPAGRRLDIQLKGSGRTPFSRGGDGRAALGPVLREFLVSEAMHALGIPTTRALAAVVTGDPVYRETPLQGAVLTRVASSHIRIGTFQYFAARQDKEALELLTRHALERHYPDRLDADNPALALFEGVIERQAALVAEWMRVGFVHGVMNTDNMSISGETIDYGPCAFIDAYDPAARFSSIDTGSRYAFANQGAVAEWNLARLAEALLPVIDADEQKAVDLAITTLRKYPALFSQRLLSAMRAKLGLAEAEEGDAALIRDLLTAMHEGRADYTRFFRLLSEGVRGEGEAGFELAAGEFVDVSRFRAWLPAYLDRLSRESIDRAVLAGAMDEVNPLYIPRNYRVEEALAAAAEGDLNPFNTLRVVLQTPYRAQQGMDAYAEPPPAEWGNYRTFCGT